MATPRLFVSSTCYDLQEIRFQLRNFIRDFGYDAVMSEFDDIFYNYETHVQDSCLNEISKCQLFILVIGNNYGSFYHQEKKGLDIPDSVTLREVRKALETKLPKHIFINKYVDYDYKNYKRALDKVTLKHFQENNIPNEETDTTREKIKKDFDNIYHFPYESYKYIFYFLDIINELKENNAYNIFESFADIKDSLRKQWAGFMYESLVKNDRAVTSAIAPLEGKLERIEKNLLKLIDSKTDITDNKLTFDLSSLARETNLENLEGFQNRINELLYEIRMYDFWTDEGENQIGQRIYFSAKFSGQIAQAWLESLKVLMQSFKWSKQIHAETVFSGFSLSKYNKWHNEIAYKTLFELYTLYNSLSPEDKALLTNTVMQELNKNYEKPIPPKPPESADDLPF